MSPEEAWAFLSRLPARTGKLATTGKDGAPHVAPVWFATDGGDVLFTTHETSLKGRNLRRDPRAALCVDDEVPPFSFVAVEGTVALSDDREAVRHWATVIAGRYMGAQQAERYGARNGVAGELLVRLRPDKIISAADVAS